MKPSHFFERIRTELRTRHYSLKTEKTYLYWVRFFLPFHHKKHPKCIISLNDGLVSNTALEVKRLYSCVHHINSSKILRLFYRSSFEKFRIFSPYISKAFCLIGFNSKRNSIKSLPTSAICLHHPRFHILRPFCFLSRLMLQEESLPQTQPTPSLTCSYSFTLFLIDSGDS